MQAVSHMQNFLNTALAALLLATLALGSTAQAQTATLDVSVLQADGAAPAAGVKLKLSDPGTAFASEATTNAQGRARFAALPAGGDYRIELNGQLRAEQLRLRANESLSITLTLAALAEVAIVARRGAAVLNATNAEVSASLPQAQIEALPVESRDLSRVLLRLPNVVASTGFYPEAPSVAINGANGLFTQYLIDGLDNNENFLGGFKFPISTGAVADVSVLAASYSVEYGRSGNGIVNVTSRGGRNEFEGEVFYLTRPGRPLDSSSPYPGRDLLGNSVRDGFRRDQLGFGLGGPIRRDRTFFFVNLEATRDQKDNLLTAPALGIATTVPGENRSLLFSTRVDHEVNERWRLALRANFGDVQLERQGGGLDGGATFPSAGSSQDRNSALAAVSAVYDSGDWISQTSLGWSRFSWNYGRALNGPGPQVTVEDPSGLTTAVIGHPGFVFDDLERSVQLTQKVSLTRGDHAWKFGADILRSQFALAGGGNPDGNYRVRLTPAELAAVAALGRGAALTPADLPASVSVLDYAVELRPATFGDTQQQFALYVEDQISLSPSLTATLGLRWDYDSLTEGGAGAADSDNLAPRLALNWRASERLALRAGAGVFYEKIPYTIASDALQQNTTSTAFRGQLQQLIAAGRLPADTNLDRVLFDGNLTVNPACPGGYLNCPTPAQSGTLRTTASSNERRLRNPDGLDSPYNLQFSLGAQWQLAESLIGYADLIYSEGRKLLRLRDLNAPLPFSSNLANLTAANLTQLRALPDDTARRALAEQFGLIRSQAAADATRPVAVVPGGARQIVVSETGGESRYRALNLTLEKPRAGGRYAFRASYTLSSLENNTDDLNFRASNSNEFDAEWGPSINDRRHVINATAYFHPLPALTVSVAALAQSGQPINLIPDTAIFGTTDLNGDGASFSTAYLGNSDRAPGVSRNADRLPWATAIDLGLRYDWELPGRGSVEFAADVFNVFDKVNLSGFANSATQSNQIQIAGQPFVERNAGAPRQFQFGLRYLF